MSFSQSWQQWSRHATHRRYGLFRVKKTIFDRDTVSIAAQYRLQSKKPALGWFLGLVEAVGIEPTTQGFCKSS